MLEAKNITFQVGQHLILDDVSTKLLAGEVLAICGPNGAGKSSLLRMLSGESRPTNGQVLLQNKPIGAWSNGDLARIRGVLHQESYLTFPFLVRDVVSLGRFPYGGTAHDKEIVTECLQKVGMLEMVNRKYTTLSGGEKQRVHLARVLAQLEEENSKPKILMLDEPTSALDLPHQESTLKIATNYAKERNYCTIVVLHDLNLAAAWADRILFLQRGQVFCVGKPSQVLTIDTIESIYGLKTHILSHPDTQRPIVTIDRSPRKMSN